jgi:NADH:ubiquinone oxidoreductase subunit 4 (subunit M)
MTFLVKNKILFLNIFNIIGFSSLFYFFALFSLDSLNNLIGLFLSFFLNSTNMYFFFSVCLLFIGFFKIVMIEHSKVFEIKKFSIFFCMNLMSFFFFYFIKVSKLYSSFFIFYSFTWFGNIINIEYNLGIDSLSIIFIFLTLFLIPICLIISWKSIYYNTKYFFCYF